MHKGKLVYIEGRLRTERYEDKGEMRFFTKVVVFNMQMLERKPEEEEPALPDAEESSEDPNA